MKTVLASIVAVVLLLAVVTVQADEEKKDGVFIHIKSNDAHNVLMALSMANKMAEDKDVLVYLDIDGIDVITKESEDITYSHFPSSHTSLKALFDKGVGVYACPGCMKAKGVTEEDLMEGVMVAEKDKFFSFTDGRILTLDY